MAERRKDLEQAPYKKPTFLADLICPQIMVTAKAGTYYYKDVHADISAQTNRTLGAAPTSNRKDSASATFAMTEAITRCQADESEISLKGGIEATELELARLGKRGVMNTLEALVAAQVLAGASTPKLTTETDFWTNFNIAKNSVLDKGPGKLAVVGSTRLLTLLKTDSDYGIASKMAFTGVPVMDPTQVRNIGNIALAQCLGVDVVLEGDNAIWYTASAAYQDRIALVMLPDASVGPNEEPQFGRFYMHKVNETDDNIFTCQSFFDDVTKSNYVDTTAWYSLEIMNPELCYVIDQIDADLSNNTSVVA